MKYLLLVSLLILGWYVYRVWKHPERLRAQYGGDRGDLPPHDETIQPGPGEKDVTNRSRIMKD